MVVKLVMNHSMGSQAVSKIAVTTKQIQDYLAPSRKSFSLQYLLLKSTSFGIQLGIQVELLPGNYPHKK